MNGLAYSILFATTALIFLGLALYGWRQRHMPGATAFCLAMLLSIVWPLTQAIDVTTADLAQKVWLMKLRIPPPYFTSVMWLLVAAQLTGQAHRIYWRWATAFALPFVLLTLLLFFDNPLYRYGYYVDLEGPFPLLRWVNTPLNRIFTVYVTLLYWVPLLLLLRAHREISPLSLQQSLILAAALSLPLFTNFAFQFNVSYLSRFNLTPIAQSISAVIIAWAVFRRRAFQIVPLARSTFFDQMNDAMIVIDLANRIVDLNAAAKKIIGAGAERSLGQPASRVLAGWPTLLQHLEQTHPLQVEVELFGDSEHTFHLQITPLYDDRQRLVGRLLIFRELTERKQMEDALRASEEKFRLLYDNNPLMLFSLATDGTVLAVNPTAVLQLGYSAAEMIGQSVLNVFHSVTTNPSLTLPC